MIRLLVLLLGVIGAVAAAAHQSAHQGAVESAVRQGLTAAAHTSVMEGSPVRLRFLDEAGRQTPAMFSLSLTGSWRQVPLEQQFLANTLHPSRFSQRRQWRGKLPIHSSGTTDLILAEGRYTLTAGKGLEFIRGKVEFEVVAGDSLIVDVPLQRWIDMPAMGWWSGDPHVHAARPNANSDGEILAAAMAEDIHLTSALEMGDAQAMHFPGHGWGAAGQRRNGDYWLAAGQEEPRTDELGHGIVLNTSRLYRDPDHYYSYDRLFAQAKADGAVTGLAHYFFAKFHSYRAGALLLPDDLVDFVELLDNGDIFSPGQYYDALNLGFELPVSAGSDYPWGEHIGDQRTYVQLLPGQQELTPQAWYLGLKAGRSFVTQGPLLRFSINGQGIGSVLHLRPGDELQIKAQAQAPPYIGSAKHVRLISMGEELAAVSRPNRSAAPLSLSHTVTATASRWYVVAAEAHNGALAHTSPIYVRIDNKPARLQGDALAALIEKQINVVRGAGANLIPPQHQSAAYRSWLERIEAYYTNMKEQAAKSRAVGELTPSQFTSGED